MTRYRVDEGRCGLRGDRREDASGVSCVAGVAVRRFCDPGTVGTSHRIGCTSGLRRTPPPPPGALSHLLGDAFSVFGRCDRKSEDT